MGIKSFSFPLRIVGGQMVLNRGIDSVVRQQLIDSVMTNYRERIMRPRYGSDIQNFVFDPADELRRSDFASIVQQRLVYMVPRATILSVTIGENPLGDDPVVYVDIRYQVNAYDEPETLSIPIPGDTA